MNVLCCPSIGLDISLMQRLAASVDYDVRYKLIINNGPLGAFETFSREHPDWIIKEPGLNLGVAGSWNEAAKLFPDESILLMNEDAYFLPGYLEKICQCADANQDAPLIHLNDSNAYYAFCWTGAGRVRFGTFDENFFIAYLEDCDMRVRHRLWGNVVYPYALQGLPPLPHGKLQSGGTNYNGMIQGCGLFNRAYWLRKWGSFNYESSAYANPYKDRRLTPKDWVWDPAERAKRHPLWETFIGLPNPSIYT